MTARRRGRRHNDAALSGIIVSREVAAAEAAVLTVGVLQAGTKENVIPDEAIIKLNVRTFDAGVRARVLAAIERIAKAEPFRRCPMVASFLDDSSGAKMNR